MGKNTWYGIIGGLVIVALIGIVMTLTSSLWINNAPAGQRQAISYAEDIGMTEAKATCMRADIDSNGYVSCTLVGKQNGQTSIVPLQCAKKFTLNYGCKPIVLSIPSLLKGQ